jgi:formylglycine-generating enzyme
LAALALLAWGCRADPGPAASQPSNAIANQTSNLQATQSSNTTDVAPSALDEGEVARLIAQLGHSSFQVREAATARLASAGHAALAELRRARQETSDAEVRWRLDTILEAVLFWNGQEPVAHYAQRRGIRETELTLKLNDKVTLKATFIPAGKFIMGSPETENSRGKDETQHEVTLGRFFFMGVTQVTVDQFAAFVKESGYTTDAEKAGWSFGFEIRDGQLDVMKMDGLSWRNPGFEQQGDHPVVNMSWNDATAFCAWLSKKSGKTVVLPTEAQWEYCCRAGTTTAYPWGGDPDGGRGWANGADQALKRKIPKSERQFFSWDDEWACTSPAGKFQANALGLHDMIGNAAQWCQDWCGDFDQNAVTDPTGLDAGVHRVLRGGSWLDDARSCRSACRIPANPDNWFLNYGFRVVVIPPSAD